MYSNGPRQVQPAAQQLSERLTAALLAIESAQRTFHPLLLTQLSAGLSPLIGPLEAARQDLSSSRDDTSHFQRLCRRLSEATGLVLDALRLFATHNSTRQDLLANMVRVMRAMRKFCQAQETLFPLRSELATIDTYFLEGEACSERSSESSDCLVHIGMEKDPYARGAFSIYAPESCGGAPALPLVVALHGGQGHGRDFVWTWVREARSRRFLLVAPSSVGSTWSITKPAVDGAALERAMGYVCERWPVDRKRILLTGLSDGATYALACGLREESPFTALAPIACTLPPVDLQQAVGRRILWIHGAHDWMFRVERARQGCSILKQAGADVKLVVIPDLSHTYPREQNDRILTWFDRGLAGPPSGEFRL